MIKFKLAINPDDKVRIAARDYMNAKRYPDGYRFISADDKAEEIFISDAVIDENMRQGTFEVVRGYFQGLKHSRILVDAPSVAELPDDLRYETLGRATIVGFFLEGEKAGKWSRSCAGITDCLEAFQKDPPLQAHLANLFALQANLPIAQQDPAASTRSGNARILVDMPSARTVLRWIKMLEAADHNAAALCPRAPARGNRRMRIAPLAHAEAMKTAREFLDPSRPTKVALYEKLVGRINDINKVREENGEKPLPMPSRTYLSKLIDSFDAYEVTFAREGKEAADKKFASVGMGPMVERIGQRVEGDEWKLHAFAFLVRHDIWRHLSPKQREEAKVARFSLTVFIDVASRVVVGMHLSASATTEAAVRAVSLIGRDKSDLARSFDCDFPWDFACGVDKIVVDNGAQFLSPAFQEAVVGLGTELQFAIAGIPRHRGTIERWFRTLHVDLIGRLPGKTFSDAGERGIYKSKEFASLTVEELLWLIIRWIVDVYHNTPHAGLQFRTPAQEFCRLADMYGVPAPPSHAQRRLALGRRSMRTLGPTGVRIANIDFNSEEIAAHYRKNGRCEVEVCLDTDRLDEVSVLLDGGWVTVPQRVPGLATGLSLDEWNQILAEVRRRYGENTEIHYETIRKAREDMAAIIKVSRSRAMLLEERPSDKEIRYHERLMGSGFRVKGHPDLVEAAPQASIGKAFKTGAALPQNPPPGQISPTGGPLISPETISASPSENDRRDVRGSAPPASMSDETTVSQPIGEDDGDDIKFI